MQIEWERMDGAIEVAKQSKQPFTLHMSHPTHPTDMYFYLDLRVNHKLKRCICIRAKPTKKNMDTRIRYGIQD